MGSCSCSVVAYSARTRVAIGRPLPPSRCTMCWPTRTCCPEDRPPTPSRRSHLVLADSHLLSIESPKSAILISKELVSRMFSGCNHESRRESNKEDFFTGSSLLWDGRAGSHQSVGWGCRAEG